MKLLSLTLQHFRCITHLHFDWESHSQIWIEGATDTGKTSLCQAIFFAFLGQLPTQETPTQFIHWNATESIVELRFQQRFQIYRIARLLNRNTPHQFRLWNETESQELFTEKSLSDKQEAFQQLISLHPQIFRFCFFFSNTTMPSFCSALEIFHQVSHVKELQLKHKQLTQQTQKLALSLKTAQEELSLTQQVLTKISYSSLETDSLDFVAKKNKTQEELTQYKAKLTQLLQQQNQWEHLKTHLGEYDLHFRHLLKQQLTQKIASLAAPFEDFIENQRIVFKEKLQQLQKQQESKKEEWKETLFQLSKIQEFRNAIQCRLQEVTKYLDDRLVRNPKTPREELCLSLSRVAQLTYIQNEIEDVLRDNKIRNFMFYSISVILMLMVPIFFYLTSLQSTYYRDQLKIRTFGGFIVLLIFILMWYLSQKLKNNGLLRNYHQYKIRLQEELARAEQEATLLHKSFYAPISQIEGNFSWNIELQQLFQQLLFLAQEGRLKLSEVLQQKLPLPAISETHLPPIWDRLDYTKLRFLEEEMNSLEEKIQETETRLTQLRTFEKFLQEISFDYPESFEPRFFSLDSLYAPLLELQTLHSWKSYLERFPAPSKNILNSLQEILTSFGNTLQFLNEMPSCENAETFEYWLQNLKIKLWKQLPFSITDLKKEIETLEKQIQETTQQLLQINAKETLQTERMQIQNLITQQIQQWKQKQLALHEEIPRLTHQIKIQETLADLWTDTLQQMNLKLVPTFEKTASLYLPLWTQGALGRVQQSASGETLLFCRDKNDFVALHQLGSGLHQMAQLALHCSLALLLWESSSVEGMPFLILDHPHAPLDAPTSQHFFRSLDSLSPHFEQILITTNQASSEKKWVLPIPNK